jgi:hypothetical protein
MKQILLYMTLALFAAGCSSNPGENSQSVNSILGDCSYESKFGMKPDGLSGESLRIRTHLEYVEDLLRQKDVSMLPADLQNQRRTMLDLLHEYLTAGVFPSNFDYPSQRIPCFIDRTGKICAVGYLVEKTAGRQVAEQINSRHRYEKILAMNDKKVDEWIAGSGLSKVECAMIQPSYGWEPVPVDNNHNHISTSYGVSSAIVGGMNLSLNVLNSVQIANGSDQVTLPVLGMCLGTLQIAMGAVEWPEETMNSTGGYTTNESQKALSMLNIGLGTSTLLLSTWNLIDKNKTKPQTQPSSWNLFGFPSEHNTMGIGFYYARKF